MVKVKKKTTSGIAQKTNDGGEMSQADGSGKKKKARKMDQAGSSAGLSAEISQLVQSMASDAEKLGEEWATVEDVKSTAFQGEDAEAKQARLANAANEDAEICGGESDAEFSDSSDDQEGASKPAASSSEKSKKKSKAESGDAASDKKARTASTKPAVQQSSSEISKPMKKNKAAVKSENQPDVPKRQKQDGQVYLSGLPFSVDEQTVRTDFGKFGEIARFFFHRDADKKPLGTACIFYETQETADKVMLLDGIDYKGRNIKVKNRGPRQSAGKRTKAAQAAWERMPEWKTALQLKQKRKET